MVRQKLKISPVQQKKLYMPVYFCEAKEINIAIIPYVLVYLEPELSARYRVSGLRYIYYYSDCNLEGT
jgi:hypothetical protein